MGSLSARFVPHSTSWTLQNKSLTAEGYVRAIACGPHVVRMLEAKLKGGLEQKVKQQVGWKQMDDRWIGVHVSKKMQNPQYVGGIAGFTRGPAASSRPPTITSLSLRNFAIFMMRPFSKCCSWKCSCCRSPTLWPSPVIA